MYDDMDWHRLSGYLASLDWGWMTLSLVFGLLAQMVRAWRWKMVLGPLGVPVRRRALAK